MDKDELGKRFDFHTKEFETLRTEIMFYITEARFLERAAIIGPALVYSWLAVQPEKFEGTVVGLAGWWLPLVLVSFLWHRQRHADRNVHRIAQYIRKLEHSFALPELEGWENYVYAIRANPRTAPTKFSRVYWPASFLFCLAVPLLIDFNKTKLIPSLLKDIASAIFR